MHFKNHEMIHRITASIVCANFSHTGDSSIENAERKSGNAERGKIKSLKYNKKTMFCRKKHLMCRKVVKVSNSIPFRKPSQHDN